jgi:hypothetical protein
MAVCSRGSHSGQLSCQSSVWGPICPSCIRARISRRETGPWGTGPTRKYHSFGNVQIPTEGLRRFQFSIRINALILPHPKRANVQFVHQLQPPSPLFRRSPWHDSHLPRGLANACLHRWKSHNRQGHSKEGAICHPCETRQCNYETPVVDDSWVSTRFCHHPQSPK